MCRGIWRDSLPHESTSNKGRKKINTPIVHHYWSLASQIECNEVENVTEKLRKHILSMMRLNWYKYIAGYRSMAKLLDKKKVASAKREHLSQIRIWRTRSLLYWNFVNPDKQPTNFNVMVCNIFIYTQHEKLLWLSYFSCTSPVH